MQNRDLPIVWTALITPLLENGEIDFVSLAKLVDAQVQAKNGILFLGSTGESLNLSGYEKKQILDWVASNQPQTPLMCGVGGSDLTQTLSWMDLINQYPFDCYLMVTPPYAKPGDHGQKEWFTTLMNRADKPCVLYNVPGRTACSLSKNALLTLQHHRQFLGIKESSGDEQEFKQYKDILYNHAVYCGDDIMLPAFSKLGACGVVSVASNAWPIQTHQYAQACLDQTFKDFNLWEQACNSLFTASNPVPVKALLCQQGKIQSGAVKLPLSAKDFLDSNCLIKCNEKIMHWHP